MGKLTAKRRKFIASYLETFNATAAAIQSGYSKKTAYSIGSEILRIPEVSAEIEARLAAHCMTANEALHHLATIARNAETAHQLKALELIAKHLGLFSADNRLRVESTSINLSDLSDSQLQAIANGEDIRKVIGRD